MPDPATGKKYGEPSDDYADDPLGRLYRRIEERAQQEARGGVEGWNLGIGQGRGRGTG
jgi:hypothetical protein